MMIKVFGVPAAKGSMKCVGAGRGGQHHQLVEVNAKKIKPWRDLVTQAGRRALTKNGGPFTGALIIEATFTVPRPATVSLSKRPYPTTRSSGDVDKMMRLVLDALDDAGLYDDDAAVIGAPPWKTYPDSPGIADRLDRPGAIIRIEEL